MDEKWTQLMQTPEPPAIVMTGDLGKIPVPADFFGLLGAMLFRSRDMDEEIMAASAMRGIVFPQAPFRMFLMAGVDPALQQVDAEMRHGLRLHLYESLRQKLIRLLPEGSSSILVLMMGYLIGILWNAGDGERVETVCRNAAEEMASDTGFLVHANISAAYSHTAEIQSAFQTLQDFEKSRAFYKDLAPQIFRVSDSFQERLTGWQERTGLEDSFRSSTEKICSAIRTDDPNAAKGLMREQLQKIAKNSLGLPYPTTFNLSINHLMSLLEYRLTNQDLADWHYLSRMDFSRNIVASPTLEACLTAGDQVIEEIMNHHRQRSEDSYEARLHDIRDYLAENATDMNIGLTAVAKEFRMKPREAAESYRRYFGESINDIVHRTRVEKAKKLLLETDLQVQEIAEKVGYCSLATMYRAFSNVEGVSPGRYRSSRRAGKGVENTSEKKA